VEYWKKVDQDGNTTTVESHSYPHEVPDAIKITKEEFDEFTASLPPPEPPPEPLVFTASPPGEAIGKRLKNIEDFLRKVYPE